MEIKSSFGCFYCAKNPVKSRPWAVLIFKNVGMMGVFKQQSKLLSPIYKHYIVKLLIYPGVKFSLNF